VTVDQTTTPSDLTQVPLGPPTQPGPHLVARWPLPFDAAVALLEERLAEADLFQLATIDTTGVFARGGLGIPPIRQVMAFHTRYMRPILERDPAAAVEAPLKVVVRQEGEGPGAVTELRTPDPAVTFAAYPTLADVGAALHDVVETLLAPPG
jgi:uncharacterized protein (DUF302 family)